MDWRLKRFYIWTWGNDFFTLVQIPMNEISNPSVSCIIPRIWLVHFHITIVTCIRVKHGKHSFPIQINNEIISQTNLYLQDLDFGISMSWQIRWIVTSVYIGTHCWANMESIAVTMEPYPWCSITMVTPVSTHSEM